MWRILKNKKGMTIIETIVAAGLVGLVALSATHIMQMNSNATRKTNALAAVIKYRTSLLANLRSSDSLAKTAKLNVPEITCLADRSTCGAASIAYSELSVFDEAAVALTKATTVDPRYGFGSDGTPCATFPSAACPFRYDTQWRFMCSGSTCMDPQIKINSQLSVAKEFKLPINKEVFSFEITLGQVVGTYEQSCVSIGGTYSAGPPPSCIMPAIGSCPPDASGMPSFVVGFDATTQTKLCDVGRFRGTCPADQVSIGTDANGNFICRALQIPPAATPPFICQVNPSDPSCPSAAAATSGGDGGGDGGCGAGDGC